MQVYMRVRGEIFMLLTGILSGLRVLRDFSIHTVFERSILESPAFVRGHRGMTHMGQHQC